jgi:hypothetical protein
MLFIPMTRVGSMRAGISQTPSLLLIFAPPSGSLDGPELAISIEI